MLGECQTMLVIFSTYITVHCPYNMNGQRWLHDSFFTASSCRIAVAAPLAPIYRPVGLQLPTRWPPYADPWDCSCRPMGPHLPPVANSWKGFRRLIHDELITSVPFLIDRYFSVGLRYGPCQEHTTKTKCGLPSRRRQTAFYIFCC